MLPRGNEIELLPRTTITRLECHGDEVLAEIARRRVDEEASTVRGFDGCGGGGGGGVLARVERAGVGDGERTGRSGQGGGEEGEGEQGEEGGEERDG